MSERVRLLGTWLALLGALAGVLLLGVRAYHAISFLEPLQLFTGGAEHESLHSIWRRINGEPVYTDLRKIPFVPIYYNWLYFEIYAAGAGAALNLLHLTDAWLPTITRLISLLFCSAGTVVLYRLMLFLGRPKEGWLKALALAFALLFFFGPLAGFWVIATNVEFPATVFLILSIFCFVRFYNDKKYLALSLFCLFAYASWAIKQIYVYPAGTVGLYLLWRRDWAGLALVMVVLPLAWAITFWASSEDYARSVFLSETHLAFSVQRILRNLANVGVKTLPVLGGLLALAILAARDGAARRVILAMPGYPLLICGLAVSTAIVLPASAQVGAAENYYFPVVLFLICLVYAGLCGVVRSGAGVRGVVIAMSVGWVGHLAAVAAVLAGLTGVLSVRNWHDTFMARKACLDRQPAPAFTTSAYNMLPWMYPVKPHFVLTYNYFPDRAAGRKFERDGIGGLIGEGYFASVLMGKDLEVFDGARLADRYKRQKENCAGQSIWIRRRPPLRGTSAVKS